MTFISRLHRKKDLNTINVNISLRYLEMVQRIYLIGYMGSGKSTIGPRMAKRLEYSFFDLDREIEQHNGKSISGIFREKGETHFRDIENRMLKDMSNHDSSFVLSTGGGTPCFMDNMNFMNDTGITVYIDLPARTLAQRLAYAKSDRPLLEHITREELESFISEQLENRKKYYEQAQVIYQPLKEDFNDLIDKLTPGLY